MINLRLSKPTKTFFGPSLPNGVPQTRTLRCVVRLNVEEGGLETIQPENTEGQRATTAIVLMKDMQLEPENKFGFSYSYSSL